MEVKECFSHSPAVLWFGDVLKRKLRYKKRLNFRYHLSATESCTLCRVLWDIYKTPSWHGMLWQVYLKFVNYHRKKIYIWLGYNIRYFFNRWINNLLSISFLLINSKTVLNRVYILSILGVVKMYHFEFWPKIGPHLKSRGNPSGINKHAMRYSLTMFHTWFTIWTSNSNLRT